LVGTVVDGKYQIVERIGVGGMGAVYRAQHLSLGAPRALKVMRPELARDPTLAARFRDEARLAEGLRHPSLVALYDFGALSEQGLYIVTELVEGATIAELLRRRAAPLRAAEVVRFVGEVAEGLALAHRRGVVHRDISPDNVMLAASSEGEVTAKLLDFGIAKDTHGPIDAGTTGTGWKMGKLGFSSPEQMGLLHHGEAIDARSDVFSLAAVAYLMLVGRLPWRNDTLQAYTYDLLLRPQADFEEEIRRHAPQPWHEFLLAALARSREARLPDMGSFRERLPRSGAGPAGDEPPPVEAGSLIVAVTPGETRTGPDDEAPGPGGSFETKAAEWRAPAALRPLPLVVPSAAFDADMAAATWLSEPEPCAPAGRDPHSSERVVLVDDDEALRTTLPGLLDRLGLTATAVSWDELPAVSARGEPLLVLADPGDGSRARARVAALHDSGVPGRRVVLFAALDPWSLRERARELGLSRYVSKEALACDPPAVLGRLRLASDA
jgi:serine/threonine-protein kinase